MISVLVAVEKNTKNAVLGIYKYENLNITDDSIKEIHGKVGK
jgi:hypothetical protein